MKLLPCNIRMFSFTILLSFVTTYSFSQNDPEFPKGFITYLKLHSGMITNFSTTPDLYEGGIQLMPQITIAEHLLRAGIIADGFYTAKRLEASFGPAASIKIKTLKAGAFGTLGNINLIVDHLWGTNHQRLIGGGIVADLGNFLTIGITTQRDYSLNNWWFQSEVGIRISKKKKVVEPFNQ